MNFIDLKNYTIVERKNFYKQIIVLDGERILDSPLSKANEYLSNKLKLTYLNRTVLFDCIIDGEIEEIDFEYLVDFVVSFILKKNETIDLKQKDELRLAVPENLTKRINISLCSLKSALDHQSENEIINIVCKTRNGNYIYSLVQD